MVKTKTKSKKRRTYTTDKHNSKTRVDTVNKVNPFDLHVNRLKHDVLGKRRNYEKGGQPLKSRSRGIEKRKRTLLKELNSVFKHNTFIDHRLGESDPTLTNEEKLMQRLIAERTKTRPGKESRYNLNDEEDLTHYGQSLSKSDELNQKPIIDEYDDDDLNKGRLNSEHFFGGFKSSNEQRKPQTKQEWIDNMIKSTKLDKYERQRENEKLYDMTQTLDEQWKALSTLMGIKEKKSKDIKEKSDDYDKLVNSLKYEAKTTSAPIKTIEEKEKETAERLKTLQVEENQRMERPTLKSILSKNKPQTHIYVEELDESYYIMDGSKKRVTFEDDDNNNNQVDKNETVSTNETEENEDNSTKIDNEDEEEDNDNDDEQTTNGDLIAEYEEIPSDIDKLQTRLSDDKNALSTIWKRINDKRLPPIPKLVLSNYFDVLLDYYESVTSNKILLNQIGKNLLHLLQLVNNEQTKTNIINRLKQYHITLNEQIENDKFCQVDLSFILFLKLIAHLYPTSDFSHSITTPAITLLVQAINHSSLKSLSSCRQALFLIDLVQQWISKSHRYVPEVIVLLIKLIQLACPIEKSQYFISYSSKQIENNQLLILNKNIDLSNSIKLTIFDTNALDDDNDEHRAIILQTCLNHLTDFLKIYQSLSAIVEITEPFKSSLVTIADTSKCSQISSQCREILTLIDTIQTTCLTDRKHLEQGKEQAKMLKLFEPRFGPVYEGKKNTRLPKEYTESLRLRQKYKRELKSVTRTLVLDNEFIAREEFKQQMEKDTQRKRKVKDIHAQLSMQEGEYRKFQKTK
ncbi:unnamed protein product [Rotaria sp. Silwood2]|nr:unnamed protein product [Rotaria sp. Silwood2]CAF2517988.1 unnamed protein product [Rotaria sp. Silwood2]CAF2969520.1 unnamed protein product [Rotaria sp. Silwood2]CAF4056342.1 unnamed protein product [Rotaria sp. Silwood2]CAF4147960.1 unnamed protein product [Rotaria sp. Silwood2]